LERGFRYFNVSPIKAFRDIRHVSVDKVFATGRFILKGRAILKNNRFLQVYFNELTGTTDLSERQKAAEIEMCYTSQ
jgi:hypothetical protein